MKPATHLVRFESFPYDRTRPATDPIYLTTTFHQESAIPEGPYDYSRSGNPTRATLEHQLARLEHASKAFCFSSGMAAITAVTRLLTPGDEILASAFLYGGTARLFGRLTERAGIRVRYITSLDPEEFQREVRPATRLIYIETPTNPLLQILDIAGLAHVARESRAHLCVDNTMMSPYLQNPLLEGADIVVHSATKFLAGHGDVTAGVVAVQDQTLADMIYAIQNGEGAVLAPFDCYLFLRGMKTLAIRVDRQQANAQAISKFLREQPSIRRMHYPGNRDAAADLHRLQARGAGSVFSFETGCVEVSRKIIEALELFPITLSFGSVSSSVSMPTSMSHASLPANVRGLSGLPPDLVRVSVGIEDADDLIADFAQALARL